MYSTANSTVDVCSVELATVRCEYGLGYLTICGGLSDFQLVASLGIEY